MNGSFINYNHFDLRIYYELSMSLSLYKCSSSSSSSLLLATTLPLLVYIIAINRQPQINENKQIDYPNMRGRVSESDL